MEFLGATQQMDMETVLDLVLHQQQVLPLPLLLLLQLLCILQNQAMKYALILLDNPVNMQFQRDASMVSLWCVCLMRQQAQELLTVPTTKYVFISENKSWLG